METFKPFNTVMLERTDSLSKSLEYTERLENELGAYVSALENQLQRYYMAQDDLGWISLKADNRTDDLKRDELQKIIAMSKAMTLNNPMIGRAVRVQKLYVWALGYTITSENPVLQEFVDNFLNMRKNSAEFSYEGFKTKEETLQYSGNLFLCFFPNPVTGDVRVRSINVADIQSIYTNPDDPVEPWFYKRVVKSETGGRDKVIWHPDWEYDPIERKAPPRDKHDTGEDVTVEWDHPIFHIKTGGTDNMRFGFPEIYSALPWATALRRFYENWSTMMESYAKVAMQQVRNDKSSLAASKSKVQTAVGSPSVRTIGDTSPSPVGQWAMHSGGVRLEAVKTAGATTGTEEGRGLAKMVAAGVGLPLTFLGDMDHGNEATATTLDRPTELRMVDRQTQWAEWFGRIIHYAMIRSAKTPNGVLYKAGFRVDRYTNRIDGVYEWSLIPPAGQSSSVTMKFPDILERNATERIRALIMGVTAMGKPVTNIIPDRRFITKKMLEALGEPIDVIEQLMARWEQDGVFADNENVEDINPEPEPVVGPAGPATPPTGAV